MSIRYLVINGSRKGIFKNIAPIVQGNIVCLMDIPEERLQHMIDTYPGTKAVYLYLSEDLENKTTHDIGPMLCLYTKFIKLDKQ